MPEQPSVGEVRPTGNRGLAEVAREAAAGLASRGELHERFLAATVFCEAGDRPGFIAVGTPGAGLVPVFSSEAELVRARGVARWFATTGADLLGLIPDGYDIGLDLAGECPLRLRPAALRLRTETQIEWS